MATRTQQFELYAAERDLDLGESFATIKAVQDYVFNLRSSWWWDRFYPNVKNVEVYPRPARMRESVGWFEADRSVGAIEMLKVHWNEQIVIHELSHVLAEERGSTAHDPIFGRTYVSLTYLARGSDAYLVLKAAFDTHGIEYLQ